MEKFTCTSVEEKVRRRMEVETTSEVVGRDREKIGRREKTQVRGNTRAAVHRRRDSLTKWQLLVGRGRKWVPPAVSC